MWGTSPAPVRDDLRVGVVAELRDEQNQQVRGLPDPAGGTFDAAGDFDDVLWRLDDTFPLLRSIDPDYTVSMGSSQMPELLAELDRLSSNPVKPVVRRGLDRLRVLAETCHASNVLSLSFIGD